MAEDKSFIVNLFNYVGNFDVTSDRNLCYISFGDIDIQLQPLFEITTSHSKVIARSQIIDGEEVFERMSVKSTEITLNGTILIKQWAQDGFSDLGRGAKQIVTGTEGYNNARQTTDLTDALDLINRNLYQPNTVVKVTNDYLNKLGIQYILIESMTTAPLVGTVGLEFSIKALDATNKKDNLKQTLIISE